MNEPDFEFKKRKTGKPVLGIKKSFLFSLRTYIIDVVPERGTFYFD